jgi:hypothetical protein
MVHGRPGAAPQAAKREEYARLIARGVPSAEACRIVGVNPRTGSRRGQGARRRPANRPRTDAFRVVGLLLMPRQGCGHGGES